MKRAWIAVVLALCGIAVALAQETPRTGETANPPALPEGLLGVVEFRSLDALQVHLEAFAAAAMPETRVPPVAATGLALLARTMNPGVMDAARPIRILLVKAGERKIAPVMQFTATDLAAYAASLPPALKKTEEKDGITTYLQEKRRFDFKAFERATPEERSTPQRFMTTTQETVCIGAAAAAVCVGESAPGVRQALALLSSGAIGERPLLDSGDVAAGVQVAALLNHLASGEGSALGGLKERMKALLALQPTPGQPPEQAQRIMEAEADALEALLKQVQWSSARLSLDAQDLRLSLNVAPVRGSALAAYLASVQPGIPATLKRLPADAFAVVACKVGNLDPLIASILALNSKIMAAAGVAPAQADLVARQVDMLRSLGDEFAFALRSGKGLRMVSAMRVKDPQAFKALVRKMPDLLAPFNSFYRNMGMRMEFEPDATPYNGHEITRWNFALDPKPPEAASPEAAAFAAQLEKTRAVFGDAIVLDSALLDKDWVQVMGNDSLDTLKQIIDGRQNSIADAEDFKRTLASMPPGTSGLALVHVTAALDWALSQARAMAGTGMQGGIPEFTPERGPGATVVFLNAPGGDTITCHLRVPSAEIKAVADGFKAAQAPMQPPAPGGPLP